MKKIIGYLLFGVCVLSCTKKLEESYSYTFTQNTSLNLSSSEGSYMKYAEVQEGDNLVFKYEYQAEDEENIADDEYSETIYFEIDSSVDEFYFSDEQLGESKLVFTQYCFCGFFDEDKDVKPKGYVTGKKISATAWDITIDVMFYADEPKNISSVFRLKE